ncbi:MAG TPA: hypothetical protein VJ841_00365 [Candidatus Saccharimonadales bacterium]|nr:hypothetical protein [Candidatus Saccharimonadales bacterium]
MANHARSNPDAQRYSDMLIHAVGASELNDYAAAFNMLGTAWDQYFRHCAADSAAMEFCTEKSTFIFERATQAYPYDTVLQWMAAASRYNLAQITALRSQRRRAAV